jgi:hypothetical protein
LDYPTELLAPTLGSVFAGNATQDFLLCFGNNEYAAPTYKETLFCMLPYFAGTSTYCNSVWGSRSVEIEVSGDIEFLKVPKLPRETVAPNSIRAHKSGDKYTLELSATRWLQYSTTHDSIGTHREIIQIPAEPIYLCARSTNWQGKNAQFSIRFRHAYLRTRDKKRCNDHTLLHMALIGAVSFVWLIPYFTALVAAVVAYDHGLKIMLTLFMLSTSVVCLTPLMLTRHNRQLARQYFNYFFTRMQAQDTRQQIKKRLPLFQAVFFSSLLIFCGFSFIYLAYYYDAMGRETRNTCFKVVLSISISWLVFSLCRSFERFFRDWLWIGMSVSLSYILDHRLNPLCRNEVVVATMVISQGVRLLVPRFIQFEFINALVSTALPRLEGVSTKLRIPLPYQIYEHHSLRHLVDGATQQGSPGPLGTSGGITHMSTSTGDLNALRHSISSRASLTHIAELQPLVDYIDEVVEGSVGNEEEGDMGNDELLSDSGKREEGEEEGDGALSTRVSEPGSAAGVDGAVWWPGSSSAARRSSDSSAGALEDRWRARNANTPHKHTLSPAPVAVVYENAPLWARLSELPGAANAITPPGPAQFAESTAATQQRNREALMQREGLDMVAIPLFGAAAVQNVIESGALEQGKAAEEGESGKMRLRSKNKKRAEVKNVQSAQAENTAPVSSTAAAPSSAASQLNMAENLVGAAHIPLSLVGPILRTSESAGEAAQAVRMWLPLATNDLKLVQALQYVASSLREGSVTCTWLAPLEKQLCFSTVLSLDADSDTPGNVASAVSNVCAVISTWSANAGLDCRLLAQGGEQERLLLLRLPSGSAPCSILAQLQTGKAAVRNLLFALRQQVPGLLADGAVMVNHQPLLSLERLVPCMQLVRCAYTVRLPDAFAADRLLAEHAQCSQYEVSAFICNTLNAVLTALELSPVVVDLVRCCSFQVARSDSHPAHFAVVVKAPVLHAPQHQLQTFESTAAARRCLALLLGGGDGTACGHNSAALSEALATVAALSYVAFLLNSES